MAAPTYPERLPLTPVTAPVHASVSLPGSKSITNRALLLAALADGESRLRAPLHSDDTFYMAQALRELGVTCRRDAGQRFPRRRHGRHSRPRPSPCSSATPARPSAFSRPPPVSTPPGTDVVLDGVARMRERPIRDLLGALLTLGVSAESVNGHGCPPVRVRGGGLPGGACRLRGRRQQPVPDGAAASRALMPGRTSRLRSSAT